MSAATLSESTADRARRAPVVRSLLLDAALSGVAGLVLAVGAPLLDELLGAPVEFLVPLGIFLVGYAAALVLLARLGAPRGAVKLVIAGNVAWIVASVVFVIVDPVGLGTAGVALTLLQAAAVGLVTELQLIGLRDRRQAPSP